MADQYNSAYTGAQIDAAVGAVGNKLDKTGDASSATAKFTAATSRANITTGEKLSVIFGKLAKWFADLKTVAFTGKYSDLSGTPTVPSAATTTPVAASEEGDAGSASTYARGDHSHPLPEVTEVELVDLNFAQVQQFTYTGTGSSTNTLTFDFVPKAVFISAPPTTVTSTTSVRGDTIPAQFVRGVTSQYILYRAYTSSSNRPLTLTTVTLAWNDTAKTLTITSGLTNDTLGLAAFNHSSLTYSVTAIG